MWQLRVYMLQVKSSCIPQRILKTSIATTETRHSQISKLIKISLKKKERKKRPTTQCQQMPQMLTEEYLRCHLSRKTSAGVRE